MELDILSGSYKYRYEDFNNQRSINWFDVVTLEENAPAKNKSRTAKFPTPGLKRFASITGTQGRGIFRCETLDTERCFAVIDDTLYEIFTDGSTTNRGNLPNGINSSGPVYFTSDSNNNMMIIDGGSTASFSDGYHIVTNNGNLIGYHYDLDTNTLSAISDIDFPNAAADVGRTYFSELNDPTNWIGDNVFTPTFKADPVRAVVAFREEIYNLGTKTLEVYLNNGTTPFVRVDRTSMALGTAAPFTVKEFHGGIIFISKNQFGQPAVTMMNTRYELINVSTEAIAYQLGKVKDLSSCTAFIQYSKEGHVFYYLHIPELDTTLVYDVLTNRWHERKSRKPFPEVDGETEQGMFRGSYYTNFKGLNLFTDRYSGNILIEDENTFTEDGEIITREITIPTVTQEYMYISIADLELDINSGYGATTGQGTNPILMFKTSKDGGKTFGKERFIFLGPLGEYRHRVKINGLGSARHWTMNFKLTDPIDVAIFSAQIHGEMSKN